MEVSHSKKRLGKMVLSHAVSKVLKRSTHSAVSEEENASLFEHCDPEKVNLQCFEDQKRRIEELGGREACINSYIFNHTPTPAEQKKLQSS